RVVERNGAAAIVEHPNTAWRLVVHEGGVHAPDKPHNNHYGVRVAHEEEIDAAHSYLVANQERYGLKRVSPPRSQHFARSLGLEIAGGGRLSVCAKRPWTPWYLVVLPTKRRKKFLSAANRFTLKLGSAHEVEAAHAEIGRVKGVTELSPIRTKAGAGSFLFSDLNRNWWEIAAGL